MVLSSNDRKHFAFLFLLLPVLTLIVGEALIYTESWHDIFPHLIWLVYPLALLIGPLFYLFVQYRLHQKQPFNLKELLHFIPFITAVFYYRNGIFAPFDTKVRLIAASLSHNDFTTFSFALMTIKVLINLTYGFLALRLIKIYLDEAMYQKIIEQIAHGKKVFAVVGRNHVPMQAAAIECAVQK